jgi:uncharacterized membrane protein YkoI
MKTKQLLAGALAGTVVLSPLAFAAGATPAQSSAAIKEDQVQLKANERALTIEEALLRGDRDTLKADLQSGRMSAMSEDSEQLYKDQQYIKGEQKDIARDKPGSPQMKSDQQALRREETQLASDQMTQRADARAGRMSAVSDDGERVYRDQQAIKAQEKQILAYRAKLSSDQKEWMANGMREHDILAIEASVAATRIDLSQAIAAAERHVHGKAVSARLEDGNGQLAYKVEVLKGDRLFEVTVHSREGTIVSAAVDKAGGHGKYGDKS